MKEEIEKLLNGAGEALETIPEIYKDGLKPGVQATGNTIALVPRAINAALTPLQKWIMNKEYELEETKKLLEQKLEKVSPEQIVSPEPYVAVPALQAISYSMDSQELRNLYANLLKSSMTQETKEDVHPSFVEIIKQLTPDEAKLLKKIAQKDSHPLIDIRLVHADGGYSVLVHNFTTLPNGICEYPNNIHSYINNLERLKLIEIPTGVQIKDSNVYKPLEDYPDVKEIKGQKYDGNSRIDLCRKKFEITQYGKKFIELCVIDT